MNASCMWMGHRTRERIMYIYQSWRIWMSHIHATGALLATNIMHSHTPISAAHFIYRSHAYIWVQTHINESRTHNRHFTSNMPAHTPISIHMTHSHMQHSFIRDMTHSYTWLMHERVAYTQQAHYQQHACAYTHQRGPLHMNESYKYMSQDTDKRVTRTHQAGY